MTHRCVPAGMRRGAIAGFALLVVAAMGVWGAYGAPARHFSIIWRP